MVKKTAAQLQREIDEALAHRAAFEKAKAEEAVFEKEMSEAQAALNVFPRGPTGLTPDAVKATPEWRAAKARVDRAFARLRAFNAVFVKTFAKELRAERAERTRERERRGGSESHSTKKQGMKALDPAKAYNAHRLEEEFGGVWHSGADARGYQDHWMETPDGTVWRPRVPHHYYQQAVGKLMMVASHRVLPKPEARWK